MSKSQGSGPGYGKVFGGPRMNRSAPGISSYIIKLPWTGRTTQGINTFVGRVLAWEALGWQLMTPVSNSWFSSSLSASNQGMSVDTPRARR